MRSLLDEELERYLGATSAREVAPDDRRAARPGRSRPPGRGRPVPHPPRRASTPRSSTPSRPSPGASSASCSTIRRRPQGRRRIDPRRSPRSPPCESCSPSTATTPPRLRSGRAHPPGRHAGQPPGPLAGRARRRPAAGRATPTSQVELVVVDTQGDRRLDVPIWELGGKGVFAKEVQAAVLDGRADLAVHSAKDLPSRPCRASCSPPCPSAAIPATRWWARPSPTCRRAPRWPPARSAVRSSCGATARTSASWACAATCRPGWPRPPTTTRSWWRPPPSIVSAWPTRSPSAWPSTSMVPQVARRRWPSSAAVDERRSAARLGSHRARPDAAGASTPSGPSWPSSAATARSPPVPTPTADGQVRLRAFLVARRSDHLRRSDRRQPHGRRRGGPLAARRRRPRPAPGLTLRSTG